MKVRLIGTRVDPYTWEVLKVDTTISIGSVAKAIAWAKQNYYHTQINIAEKVK